MAQRIPLPLTVSCFSKTQIGFTFLVLAHLGSPGQRAVKRVCVCVCSPADTTASQNHITSYLIWIQTGFTFLVLFYPGCTGKKAVKRVYVWQLHFEHMGKCLGCCSYLTWLLKATWLQFPAADRRPANTFSARSRSSRLSGKMNPFLHNRPIFIILHKSHNNQSIILYVWQSPTCYSIFDISALDQCQVSTATIIWPLYGQPD